MTEKKFIIIITVLSFVLLFGGIAFISKTTSSPQVISSQNARATISSKTDYDFGKVAYNGENVQKTYVIKNSGTDVLKLYNIKTSCHCTKAYVTTPDGSESPYFGMSGISSWVGEVLPNKEAKITVIFDPKYHGLPGVGPVTRYISLETNDKSNPKLTLTLAGIVTR